MIFYLVTDRHSYAIEFYLQLWAPNVRHVLTVVPYEKTAGFTPVPGTYVFADMERLNTVQKRLAHDLHAALRSMPDEQVRVLNPPDRVLGKYELLDRLHEAGINDFRAFRLSELRRPPRFPVFIKPEQGHGDQGIKLLHDQTEFETAIVRRWMTRTDLNDLLVIEFLDTRPTAETGYRKYSAFVVGDQVVPRHLFRGSHWVVKLAGDVGPQAIQEELDYLATNPHEHQIREVASLGGFGYGRIDYALWGDRIQVWEFNTNPVIFSPPEHFHEPRMPTQRRVAEAIATAFEKLDASHPTPSLPDRDADRAQIFRPPALSGAGSVRHSVRSVPWIRRMWRGARWVKRRVKRMVLAGMKITARIARPWAIRRLEKKLWC